MLALMKPKPRQVDVTNLFLWNEVLKEKSRNLSFERLKRNLPLLLQILIVVLAALALAKPIWTYQTVKKGNVLETARIAGIMAAKQTSGLIPMCHPLNITHVQIDFFPDPATNAIRIEAIVKIVDQTGVEMEALTAVSIAALTIYDMCKASDKHMTISDIMLLKKTGGKSGTFYRDLN